jgi:hypothetical protein
VVGDASNETLLECLRKALGKLPANLREVTEEQRRIAVRACPEVRERLAEALGEQPPRPADKQPPPVVVVASDEELRDCIRKALGYLPADRLDVTDEQRRLVERACPEVRGRLAEVLERQQPRPADQQQQPPPSDKQPLPSDKQLLPSDKQPLPSDKEPAPVVSDAPNKALWDCIRRALGYLPASTGEITDEQKRVATRACPEARDRLGPVLLAASDAATQRCIQNILRRVPGRSEDVTDQEKERIRSECFSGAASLPGQPVVAGQAPAGGESIPAAGGDPAADAFQQLLEQQLALMQEQLRLEQVRLEQEQERLDQGQLPSGEGQPAEEGPRRGFFTNSAVGEANAVDKLMDPSTLAVLGILITLLATSLSLLKGN